VKYKVRSLPKLVGGCMLCEAGCSVGFRKAIGVLLTEKVALGVSRVLSAAC